VAIMPASFRAAARAQARRLAGHSRDDPHVSAPRIIACPSLAPSSERARVAQQEWTLVGKGTQFWQRSWWRVNFTGEDEDKIRYISYLILSYHLS